MNDSYCPHNEMEAGLVKRLHSTAAEIRPGEAFADRLEVKLLDRWERAAQMPQSRRLHTRWFQVLAHHRWATVGAGLLLVVAVVLAILGPQRVWADLLHLLGYVPGVGFIDLDETRVLFAPVEVTRDGVTLRVEQVLAGPNGTAIVIESTGLAGMDRVRQQAIRTRDPFEPVLRLPDGGLLEHKSFTLHMGGGTLRFPPLPQDVYHLTLLLPRLPLVPSGQAPENWIVPLTLGPATGEWVDDMFPQPYAPDNVCDTHHNITLCVLAAAHSPQETALRLQLQWTNPDWETHFVTGDSLPTLQDDLGFTYHDTGASGNSDTTRSIVVVAPEETMATPTPTPAVPTLEQTMTFGPVSPAAQELTFTMDGLRFHIPADASFALDLGENPQVGDQWPLDVRLQVAGVAVHVTGARLLEEQLGSVGGARRRQVLQFEFDPVPDQGNLALRGIALGSEDSAFQTGYTGGYTDRTRRIRAGLVVQDGATMPSGTISVAVNGATILVRGPWELTWKPHTP